MRINKYLAACGVVSRRKADEFVLAGRVAVNSQIVDTPGLQIDEINDEVTLDKNPVKLITDYTYLVLNKPAGYLTSRSDPHHNLVVTDLLKGVKERVNPVGRLDLDTEGVLLFTNDGEMAHRLSHPRYEIEKVYLALVKGRVTASELTRMAEGITLPDGATGRADGEIVEEREDQTDLQLTLTEGRKREVKHLCSAIGHPVLFLRRLKFAGIMAGDLKIGSWRYLTVEETNSLRRQVKLL